MRTIPYIRLDRSLALLATLILAHSTHSMSHAQSTSPVAKSPSAIQDADNSTDIPPSIASGSPDVKRIREIADHLSTAPVGVGRPISDREAWSSAFPNPEPFISNAWQMTKAPTPQLPDSLYLIYNQTGNRREFEDPYSQRIGRLTTFTLAECMENKGRFLPFIETELTAILSEKTWTMPAHDSKLESFNNGKLIIDLGASMRAWNIATADHLLGSKLSPQTRAKIRSEIYRRVLDPYKKIVLNDFSNSPEKSKWWLTTTNNWNAVCHAGVVGSALTLATDPMERAWYLAAMEIHIANFLSGFTPDGYCSEGIGYWNYGFGHYVAMAAIVDQATGGYMNLFAPPHIANILFFPRRLELLPGIYPAYADCVATAQPSPWIFQVASTKVKTPLPIPFPREKANINPQTLYIGMIYTFGQFSSPTKESSAQNKLPIRDNFPDSGIIICRTPLSARDKGFAISIKAGHNNEHHNHNDVGSFVVAINGRVPILDPGAETYTKRTFSAQRYESKILNSFGHSVPVVAGKLQDTGREACGTISTLETTDEKDTYTLDLTRAYAQSVPSLKKLTRQVTFIRSPQPSAEITDEVEFDSAQSFEDALLIQGKYTSEDANTIIIQDDSAALRVKIDTEGKAISLKEDFLEGFKWRDPKFRVYRLGFVLKEPVTRARIRYIIGPANTSTAP